MSLGGLFDVLREVPAYQRVADGLVRGSRLEVSVPDAAKPVVLGALWQQLNAPVLVVCARPEDARRLVEQLEVYCGESVQVHHFVESEVLPYERMAVDISTVHQRLSVLGAVRDPDTAPLVVASTMALMQRTLAPQLLDELVHTITVGDAISTESLLQRWVRMGYEVVPMVEAPGSVSRRGGIIDIFTPGQALPVRIDLWGDRVDSLRLFDPGTQRSLEPVESVSILPALEILPSLASNDQIDRLMSGLDYSNTKTAERDRMNEGLAELMAGTNMGTAGFFSGFFHGHTLLDHIDNTSSGQRMVLVLNEPSEQRESAQGWEGRTEKLRLTKEERGDIPLHFPPSLEAWEPLSNRLEAWPTRLKISRYHQGPGASALVLPFGPCTSYHSQMERLNEDLLGMRIGSVVIASQHSQRITEVLQEGDVGAREVRELTEAPTNSAVTVVHAALTEGWTLRAHEEDEAPLLTVFTDTEVFGNQKRQPLRRRTSSRRRLDVEELVPGQMVVHTDHGIGRYTGITEMGGEGTEREYLMLEYAQGDKLYVPMDQLDRVGPYVGGADQPPTPSRLGTQEWGRTVARAREATRRLAVDLLALYARRETAEGHAFAPDSPWQREMEDAFPFVETPDQAEAIHQVKVDMEGIRPMDRLVCSDVGYGKTEVALRAAFKAVTEGKQVAVLVPTTVLAQQHYVTFTERFDMYAIRTEVLSRFRTGREQDEVVAALKQGQVDIVIGTHRLLQKDVGFKDLGLVIIDEEHRFGVGHKERLKEMRSEVDVLTMTATPIPRTLHMAVAGIRDISTMETPPEQRLPIKTHLGESSDEVVREAVLRELDRGGQVFYLHNRVKSIDLAANQLRELLPEARVMVAHGQMREGELARAMSEFAAGEADVLLCTTIIESGLDLPAVNTLIIERADRFGLSQLYQLRGRIGRRAHRGYAYLLVPRGRRITETAQRRLQTVIAATELGAGFRIAMKDLEIRGAGNLLGAEQSGYIHAVGFDLYSRLLSEAVAALRAARDGEEPSAPVDRPEPQIDLGLPAFIPEDLVEHVPTRMMIYQQMGGVREDQEVDELVQSLRDRFGGLPDEVHHLFYGLRVKVLARRARVESVSRRGDQIILKLVDPVGGARVPLERALGHGVRAGNQQLHLPLNSGETGGDELPWGQVLIEILSRLESFQQQLPEALDGVMGRQA